MTLSKYFEQAGGKGVLATADATGQVDAAVYARPYVRDDDTIALVMADRLSHKNLQSNPHAVYLFMEGGGEFEGKRLHLTKIDERTDGQELEAAREGTPEACQAADGEARYVVTFRVDNVRPLVGD